MCVEPNKESALTPLRLLSTAYADQLPIDNRIFEETCPVLHRILAEPPVQERRAILQSLYSIISGSQRQAFEAGARAGFQLAEELSNTLLPVGEGH
ncbi:MAG: hypothetical protein Q4F81_13305 [Eubacteriales bacterium]|nr:hypothetical protein [Eubacteriales bacterium]